MRMLFRRVGDDVVHSRYATRDHVPLLRITLCGAWHQGLDPVRADVHTSC
jgi:hypothetical protein